MDRARVKIQPATPFLQQALSWREDRDSWKSEKWKQRERGEGEMISTLEKKIQVAFKEESFVSNPIKFMWDVGKF